LCGRCMGKAFKSVQHCALANNACRNLSSIEQAIAVGQTLFVDWLLVICSIQHSQCARLLAKALVKADALAA